MFSCSCVIPDLEIEPMCGLGIRKLGPTTGITAVYLSVQVTPAGPMLSEYSFITTMKRVLTSVMVEDCSICHLSSEGPLLYVPDHRTSCCSPDFDS